MKGHGIWSGAAADVHHGGVHDSRDDSESVYVYNVITAGYDRDIVYAMRIQASRRPGGGVWTCILWRQLDAIGGTIVEKDVCCATYSSDRRRQPADAHACRDKVSQEIHKTDNRATTCLGTAERRVSSGSA